MDFNKLKDITVNLYNFCKPNIIYIYFLFTYVIIANKDFT